MADKKQYYLKFNVKDFKTDPKVCACSASSVGVYIMMMCTLFDAPSRGKHALKIDTTKLKEAFGDKLTKLLPTLLPRQNVQQTNQQEEQQIFSLCEIFAEQLSKHLPFTQNEVRDGIYELLVNNVLYLEGDYICQKRMVRDAEISQIRSKSGKEGAQATNKKNKKEKPPAEPETPFAENLPPVLPRQNQQQKSNYNSDSNYNYKEVDSKGVLRNEGGGAGESEMGGEEEEGDVQHYTAENYHLQVPVAFCQQLFFNNQYFSRIKEQCLIILGTSVKFGDDLSSADQIGLLEERLALWALEFNEFLIRSGDKNAVGEAIKQMKGKDCWPDHFYNWLKKQGIRLKKVPDKRIDNQEVKSTERKKHMPSPNATVEEQMEFYRRKNI